MIYRVRALWLEAPARLLLSILLVGGGIGLLFLFPSLRSSPYLYNWVLLAFFLLGIAAFRWWWGTSHANEDKMKRTPAFGLTDGEASSSQPPLSDWQEPPFTIKEVDKRLLSLFECKAAELESDRKQIWREFFTVTKQFRKKASETTIGIVHDESFASTILAKAFLDFGFTVKQSVLFFDVLEHNLNRILARDLSILILTVESRNQWPHFHALDDYPSRPPVVFLTDLAYYEEVFARFRDILADTPDSFKRRFINHISTAAHVAESLMAGNQKRH